ncbi:MAG: HTH domain-containing protein [Bacteroidales bacterium]|nr:HTH domain-containing protein [Bacteroidales bacterium]
MTWKEAIILVLKNSYRNKELAPMHYQDITDKILSSKLKRTTGLTPKMTVSAVLTKNPRLFNAKGDGYYGLSEEGKQYADNSHIHQSSNQEQETQEEDLLNNSIEIIENEKVIKHYGVFWNRENVDWNGYPFKLLGIDSQETGPIDFRSMRGVYLLYDFREVVYVGQAVGNSSIADRLKAHTKDRHANRWNRFSWFGIDKVDGTSGRIIPSEDNLRIDLNNLVDALEGLLIEGIEPRQNRRGGDNFGNEYNQYIPDN